MPNTTFLELGQKNQNFQHQVLSFTCSRHTILAITFDTLADVLERLIGTCTLSISSSATIYNWLLYYGVLGLLCIPCVLILVRLGRRRSGWLVAVGVTIAVCADLVFGTRYFYNYQQTLYTKYAKATPSASLERRIRELANKTGYKLEGRLILAVYPDLNITYHGMFGYGALLIPEWALEVFSEDEVVAKVALEMGRWAHGGYLAGYLMRNLLFAVQMFIFWRLLHSSEYFLDQGFTKDDIIEEKSSYKQAAVLILKALMVFYWIHIAVAPWSRIVLNQLHLVEEYMAARYAVKLVYGQDLISLYNKLANDSPSRSISHWLYASLNYGPTAVWMMRILRDLIANR